MQAHKANNCVCYLSSQETETKFGLLFGLIGLKSYETHTHFKHVQVIFKGERILLKWERKYFATIELYILISVPLPVIFIYGQLYEKVNFLCSFSQKVLNEF